MTPEQFKLLGTLPGLYYARDQIQNQIDMIEQSILGKPESKKLGRSSKVQVENSVEISNSSKLRSQKMKEHWANMSPEDRQKRREKMNKALRKSHKIRKAQVQS